MQFVYRVATPQGKIETGKAEAETREQLIIQLKAEGKFPLEVKTDSQRELVTWIKSNRLSKQERLSFTQQLADLLSAGIPLERALAILSRLSASPTMSSMVIQMRRLLQEGHAFTATLERFPKHFPPLYVNMVRAGEAGGILPEVLNQLSRYLEEEINLKRFVISSLIYPAVVAVASVAAILFYVGVVVPKFQDIFEDIGSELPIVTRLVMMVGNGFKNYWWIPAIFIIGGIFWLAQEWSTSEGRLRIDQFKLKVPLVGVILQKIAMARMTLALSLLSRSGVPLMTGLSITGEIVENAAIAKALQEVEREVKQGNTLAGSMATKPVFPVLAVEMIGVGEESGNLGEMLDQVARTYEGEVRHSLSIFLAIFEPALILVMVGVIAILAVAILMPIINMNSELNPLG